MKHEFNAKVYYHDTDCYGIVWHGAYIKWFEIGRVELSRLAGVRFKKLDEMGILLPVVGLNCRYKSPARVLDEITVITEIQELKKTSITFSHTIKNANNDNLILNATVTIVATDKDGKLLKKMPDYLYKNYEKILETNKEA